MSASLNNPNINPRKRAEFKQNVFPIGTIWTTSQYKDAECGPCCVSIVLRQTNHPGQTTLIDQIRAWSQDYGEGSYRPTANNVTGRQATGATTTVDVMAELEAKLKARGATQNLAKGATQGSLANVLNTHFFNKPGDRKWQTGTYQPTAGATVLSATKQLKQYLKSLNPTKPCICQVVWD